MKLLKVELNNVRAIEHAEIDFAERGVTLIEGPNESGKSTILGAILAVFEYPHTSRKEQAARGATYLATPGTLRAFGRSGGPEVTLTLETQDGRFTIFKRWLEKPQARLEQETPTRRIWEGKEAEEKLKALMGNSEPITALLLAQGTGMEVFDPTTIDSLEQGLSNALAEAGSTGDSDENTDLPSYLATEQSTVLAPIRDEYRTYFTEKKGEPTGEYRAAIDALAQAQAAYDIAHADAVRYRRDRERYQELLADITHITTTLLPEAERRHTELTAQRTCITELETIVESARATLAKSESDVRLARTKSEHRAEQITQLEWIQQQIEELQAALVDATARADDFDRRKSRAELALHRRSKEAAIADWVAELFRIAEDWNHAATRAASLSQKLDRAADAKQRLEEAEAKLSDRYAVLDDARFQQIDEAFRDVEVRRSVLEATAGTMTIQGPEGYYKHFTLDEDRELTLGEYTVTITAGDGADERADELRTAQNRLTLLTGTCGLSTLEEARARHTAYTQARDQRTHATNELEAALDGKTLEEVTAELTTMHQRSVELNNRYTSLRSQPPADIERPAGENESQRLVAGDDTEDTATESESSAHSDLDSFVSADPDREPASSGAPAARSSEQSAFGSAIHMSTEGAPIIGEVGGFLIEELVPLGSVGDVDFAQQDDVNKLVEITHRYKAVAERELAEIKENYDYGAVTVARNNLENAQATLEATRATLAAERTKVSDDDLAEELREAEQALVKHTESTRRAQDQLNELEPEAVKQELDSATTAVANINERLARYTGESAELRGGLEALALRPAAAEEAEAELERAKQTLASVQRRAEAAKLLWETVNRHYTSARRTWAAPYLERLTDMARRVFGEDVSFDPKDDDPLGIRARVSGSISVPMELLSGGAKEQMGILQRLAVADLLPDGVPVLLDDALGYADPHRIRRMNRVLADSARRHQIIICTCVPERYQELESTRVDWTWH